MRILSVTSLLCVTILLQGAPSVWAQTVPAQLALYQDPLPGAAPNQLVLGVTTLDEARRLFPDAPSHPGPMVGFTGNPTQLGHRPDVKLGDAVIKPRHAFFLGSGQALLVFDHNGRLVSISQAHFGYQDPVTGKSVTEPLPWDGMQISRNDFHARYPRTKGEWVGVGYQLSGPISECLALSTLFDQPDGYDRLIDLGYIYTCPTQPQ